MKKNDYGVVMAVLLICLSVFAGCGMKNLSEEKKGEIDYTVVAEADMPEMLKNAIAERMKEPFKLSYIDKGELYIATGYGMQQSGGYSIVINDLYQTDDTVVFETTLTGPDELDKVQSEPTYPYIVVKTEYVDKEVVIR